jgi:hypothetical protein
MRPIAFAIVTAGIIACFAQCRTNGRGCDTAAVELAAAKESVTKRLQELSRDIAERLAAFSDEVGSDQLFSLRLLVENNRSSPEVAQKAGRFLKPMGFTLLDVTDSAFVILSSGEFPASAGQNVSQKVKLLADEPKILEDNIVGQKVLTFQAKHTFLIAGSIPFYALGGVTVDERFHEGLSPRSGVRVLLKQGTEVVGMASVRTISEVKNGKVIINDKEYPAFETPLPYAGSGDAPRLIIVLEHRT